MSKSKRTDQRGHHPASRANLTAFHRAAGGRQSLKHGVGAFLASGEIPQVPDGAEIARRVDALTAQMISDLGASSLAELSAQKQALVESQEFALTVVMLCAAHIRREGLLNRRGKPQAVLATAAAYLNAIGRTAKLLGLERTPKNVTDLESIAAEYAEKHTQTEQGAES